jgi:hypothetical protein
MVAMVLPILGLAFFGPGQILAATGRRRRRFVYALGFGVLLLGSFSCTSSLVANHPSPTPVVSSEPGPSPSPSPSPSC